MSGSRRQQNPTHRVDRAPASTSSRNERRRELAEFLRTRREKITPADVGLTPSPSVRRRRATGLRRDEVAQLAGMSTAWYVRLEQGYDARPSDAMLHRLASALQLDSGERTHLFRLARGAAAAPNDTLGQQRSQRELTSVQRMLDLLNPWPAFVMDRYWDVQVRNAALERFLPDLVPTAPGHNNVVRYILTSSWRERVDHWDRHARTAIGGLRASLGASLAEGVDDERARELIAELSETSPEFRAWWPEHHLWDASRPVTITQMHPTVGRVVTEASLLTFPGSDDRMLVMYMPCNTASIRRLRDLSSARD